MNTKVKLIQQRLEDDGKKIVDPIVSQIVGILASFILAMLGIIIFEAWLSELFVWMWNWLFWVFRILFWGASLLLGWKFLQAGLEPNMPVGFVGVPRLFGKPLDKAVYITGRHWTLPGKGNGMALVDIRRKSLEAIITVTSSDLVKMSCKLSMMYRVYDPHTHIEVDDFQKSFNSLMSQAFLDIASDTEAENLIKIEKSEIIDAVTRHICEMPKDSSYDLEDYGIEIIPSTISAGDGFDFFDDTTRNAYELKARELKQKEGEIEEVNHFINMAQEIADRSGGTVDFQTAFTRVHQQYGKGAPQEHILRVAGIPDGLIKVLIQNLEK